ncbi:MAG: hypothetical protein WA373_15195 [Burkholderiales bacterium]
MSTPDTSLPVGDTPAEEGLDWWCDGWWREANYKLPYPPSEIERCVELIRPFFTSRWLHEALSADGNHELARRLIDGQGYRMALFIVSTGRIFELLREVEGFERKLSELKGPKHASTYFELTLASAIARWGAKVRFPLEGKSKQADLICENASGSFAVECKRLGDERWEIWEQALFNRLMMSSATRDDGENVTQIELNPRLSELRLDDEFSDINEQLLAEFEQEIAIGLQRAVDSNSYEWNSLGGLGRVRMALKGGGEYGSVSGFEISPTAKLRRILRYGVLEAASQLPSDIPGLIAVYSYYLPDPSLAAIAFRAICKVRPHLMSKIVALVVFPGGTIFHHTDPMMFLNPYSSFDAEASNPVQMVRSVYGLA